MTENNQKKFIDIFDFSEIVVADHSICDYDLRKEIKLLV